MNIDDKGSAYDIVIAKYEKPSDSWTDSQFESIADDVYTTFFEKAEPENQSRQKQQMLRLNKATSMFDDVPECSKIKEKEDQQDVHHDTEVIVIGSSSSELECSSTSELECSSISKLEFPSSDELSSYVSSYDELDSYDESGCLEKSVSGSIKKSISQKDPSKDLLKLYEDVKDQDKEEIDEEDDEIDKEVKDGKDDSDDELWSLKSIGTTSKSLPSPKIKETSSKSTPTTKKLVVKRSEPVRNCIIGLANNKTWEVIVNKEFRVKKEQVKENKEQVKKGKRKLGV
ncbi:hypothetical protein Tco_0848536 [Tanacetum coccineum]